MTDYNQRKYDLVIFGATGFTGERTCKYLVEMKDTQLSWAIAGRNLGRLEKVKEGLVSLDADLKDLDILIADSSQPETLDSVLSQTRVVLSTVGPFSKYGTPLVEACIRQKTHYVDTTGEYNWVKQIINNYHEQARQNNVMIVPTCGFDCIPSDMGVYMLAKHAHEQHNLDLAQVKMSVRKIKGGVSGGTLQSSIGVFTDKSLTRQEKVDPYTLASRRGIDKPALPVIKRDHDFGNTWQAFYFMSPVNIKVVQRSWSIWTDRGSGYGTLFKYSESITMKFLPALIMTSALYIVTPIFALLFQFPRITEKVLSWLPNSGQGPSDEEIAKGCFDMEFIATTENEPYDEPVRIKGIVKGFRDPGYAETCRMVAESALCIIKSLKELPGKEGGILTPATAFGQTLIDRLTVNGAMVFEAHDL